MTMITTNLRLDFMKVTDQSTLLCVLEITLITIIPHSFIFGFIMSYHMALLWAFLITVVTIKPNLTCYVWFYSEL